MIIIIAKAALFLCHVIPGSEGVSECMCAVHERQMNTSQVKLAKVDV